MSVVSGQIAAWTNILYSVNSVQTPFTIPFNFPDKQSGPLSILTYTNGTGSLQFDTIYAPVPIVLAATTLTIDLTSLTDPDNVAANFARVRELIVYNPATSAGFDIKIEQGASNPWAFVPAAAAPAFARYGGGYYRLSDPTSTGAGNGNVVGGASKTIKFDSGANTVVFWLLILGTSVA